MKKFLSFFLTALLLTSTVFAAPVVKIEETKTLMRGVEYKNIKGLYPSGWQDIHIVTADLNEKHIALEVLKSPNGVSYMENTKASAEKSDTVIAVNGDFFAAKRGETGRGSAVGVEIIDGKLYSSASVEESMNTLYKAMGDTGFKVDSFLFDITLTAQNGLSDKIKLINKYDDQTGIVMYTSDWNDVSCGSLGGIIEVSVDKYGKVLEKATESEPIKIPDGGYVLSSHLSFNTFLYDNVEVGDKLKIDIKSTPDYKKIETAVGGGGILVREGIAQTEFSHEVTGRHPRTVVGLDKTGTKLTFVVLDGRNTNARGMTQVEAAELMVELGCFTAINFDGGGSSVMIAEDKGEKKVLNVPSNGSIRNVANSIGITTNIKKNTLKSIKINAPEYAFLGHKAQIEVIGIDTYDREFVPTGTVKYKTDNGKIKEGILIPEKTGKTKITATLNGKTKTAEIEILEEIHELSFDKETYELKSGDSITPTIFAKDKDGKSARILPDDIEITSSDESVKIIDGKIIAESMGAFLITAKSGEVLANAEVLVDGAESMGKVENTKIPDDKNTYQEIADGGYRFAVFGNTKKNEIMFDRLIMNRACIKMRKTSDFQFFLGGDVNENTLSFVDSTYYMAKEYSVMTKNGDTFITLPNETSKIYTNDTSIWTKFSENVKNSKGNLFVFLDRNFISENETEVKIFKRLLEEQAKTRCVYVFGGGFVNSGTKENGVRYINTAGFFNSVTPDGTSIDYIKYLLVTVNGDFVTYEYKQAVN